MTDETPDEITDDAPALDLSRDGMRNARLRALDGFWGDTKIEENEDGPGRFAAAIDHQGTTRISTWPTMREALAIISSEVLDGGGPVGVIDLDTGAAHGVHTASPIVTDIGAEGAPGLPWGDVDTETLTNDETNGETSHGPRYVTVPAAHPSFDGERGYVIEHAGTGAPVGQVEGSSRAAYQQVESMNNKIDHARLTN
jgi:hypothetical protein